MICKNCNAEIADVASVCPFCGAPVTADVDPGVSGPVNLNKSTEEPAQQYNNPTPPPQYNNQTPPPQYNNPTPPPQFTQTPPPQATGQSYSGTPAEENEYDKQAKLPFTLGIVGLVANGVGLLGFACCCWYIPQIVAIVVGIIGMVKANGLQKDLFLISPENQQKMKNGKTMCLVSLILGAVGIVVLTILMICGVLAGMSEGITEYLE
ncbi:MAG: zinc-ribbon domain-containing protein [Oscillospiraceae bacterium]|nr:zinc-ribbon domain-containing protein [Oscillospiraceae bacterium]